MKVLCPSPLPYYIGYKITLSEEKEKTKKIQKLNILSVLKSAVSLNISPYHSSKH